MLQELAIRNLALIDALDLSWPADAGLTVLTGETGAGKSIILQAVNLLAGGRASGAWVRGGSERAVIEAVFAVGQGNRTDASPAALTALLNEHGLEADAPDGPCVIRRILHPDGRSRLFVNDRHVSAKVAAELAALLVNIAGQHDQQRLLQAKHHLDFLDDFGELGEQRRAYAERFNAWRQAEAELARLRAREADRERERAFLSSQAEEIAKIQPLPGEDEALVRERDRLKSSEALLTQMTAVRRHLADAENLLTSAKKLVDQACLLDADLAPAAERVAAAGFELEDLAATADRYLADLPTDMGRLEEISARLGDLRQLQRKYGPTLEEVLAFAERAAVDLAELDNMEEAIRRAEKRESSLRREAEAAAEALSAARRTAAADLSARMERELAELNFLQARFTVDLRPGATLKASGRDEAAFLFSANPGEPSRDLAKIVSGGELSRLLLAMKCLLARRDAVETVIFDEVDAGIGGQTAEAVAAKIGELAGHHQVLCITHLPQIAARADHHLKVEKRVEDGRTATHITLLDEASRRAELARMLDGEAAGAKTHAYVDELLARTAKSANRAREAGEDTP